jgi:hypothetical protein
MVPNRYEGLVKPLPLISHKRLGYFATGFFWPKTAILQSIKTRSRVLMGLLNITAKINNTAGYCIKMHRTGHNTKLCSAI